jgi:hypothetical protein
MRLTRAIVAFPLAALFAGAACEKEREPAAPVSAAAAASIPRPPAPLLRRNRGPWDPSLLRCDKLLPEATARGLLGFAPNLLERRSAEGGEVAVVCSHRGARPAETFSFQIACGAKGAPAVFEKLRAVHAAAAGARPATVGRSGLTTRTSTLFVHPDRPCLVQVTGEALARGDGLLERVGERIADAVP